jgi:hypothetical protein
VIRATTIAAALLLAAGGASGVAAQGCLKADDKAEVKITGTLVIVKFKHPNGTNLQAYVVRLPRQVCADVTDMDNKVHRVGKIARVQVSGELDERTFKRLLDKRVTVGGTLFGQHTAYHIAPILIQMKSIDQAR